MCKPDMIRTATTFLEENNLYDYRIFSTYGIDEDSVKLALRTEGVADAEASIEHDAIITASSGVQDNMKAIMLPERINTLELIDGRMPEKKNECVLDSKEAYNENYQIGDTITVGRENKSADYDAFAVHRFTIVGVANSPLYLDYERGTTTVGDGSLLGYFYVMREAFDSDYYTQLYIKLQKTATFFPDKDDTTLQDAEAAMEDLAENITDARREKEQSKAQDTLDEKRGEYEKGVAELNTGIKEYRKGLSEYRRQKSDADSQFEDAERQLLDGQAQIDEARKQADDGMSQLLAAKKDAEDKLASTINPITKYIQKETIKEIDSRISQVEAGYAEIDANQAILDAKKNELISAKNKAQKEFSAARATLDKSGRQIAAGKAELENAHIQIMDAQHQINTMKKGDSYALSRENNVGYSTFDQNAAIVSNIAKVFPLFFFLVAALVCMTTMTRMMEEQRSQIGVLKALGYSNRSILGKYMFYSGSAATLGAVLGLAVGTRVFPQVIWHAYTMMYYFNPHVAYIFDWKLAAVCLLVALICSAGATWISCAQDFGVAPAQLIRPKTPRAGKRILLERIGAIWDRISFLYKVSLRNIFRYKKRFLMMVIGIAGCTALLVAGFGIDTSIKGPARFQYEEICLYDYQVMFSKDMARSDQEDFVDYATRKTGDPGDILFVHSEGMDLSYGNKSREVTLVASNDERIQNHVKLHYDGQDVDYPGDGEVVVCRKLQKVYGLKPGDEITLSSGYKKMTATVSGIFDNYVQEKIFMTEDTYIDGFGEKPDKKTAYVMAPEGSSDDTIHEAAARIGNYEYAAATSVNADMVSMVDSMMKSLDAVVYVIILCAGLLAFIVLYNLTNINITERIREIATIKVLGFNRSETSSYVFRENIFLTAMGALVGLLLGKALLDFAISNINVNMIFFVSRVTWQNYLCAFAMTFIFALIVNLAMQPVLRKISMTESLKSIE